MGTNIYDANGLKIRVFFGGIERGKCWAIHGDAELTKYDIKELISILRVSLDG